MIKFRLFLKFYNAFLFSQGLKWKEKIEGKKKTIQCNIIKERHTKDHIKKAPKWKRD